VTSEHAIRFFMQRPFQPFMMCLVDGRELHVPHLEFAVIGKHAAVVYVTLPTRQIGIVDTSLIISLRTIYASDLANWEPDRPDRDSTE